VNKRPTFQPICCRSPQKTRAAAAAAGEAAAKRALPAGRSRPASPTTKPKGPAAAADGGAKRQRVEAPPLPDKQGSGRDRDRAARDGGRDRAGGGGGDGQETDKGECMMGAVEGGSSSLVAGGCLFHLPATTNTCTYNALLFDPALAHRLHYRSLARSPRHW
jgi:hypothetical protein